MVVKKLSEIATTDARGPTIKPSIQGRKSYTPTNILDNKEQTKIIPLDRR